MKNVLLISLLAVTLPVAFTPMSADAALADAQIKAILLLLQSFGADQATVNNVNLSLRGQPTSGISTENSSAERCTFTRNLTIGSRGEDVACLQRFLKVYPSSGFFGALTKQAVSKWQVDNGIVPASGYFGPLTRKHISAVVRSSEATPSPLPIPLPPAQNLTPTPAPTSIPQIELVPQTTATPPVALTPTPPSTVVEPLSITSVTISTTLTTAQIVWTTNKLSQSKVFITGGGIYKVIQSESGSSMRHIANVTSLTSGTSYSYQMESTSGTEVTNKDGTFSAKPDELALLIQADKTSVQLTSWNYVNITAQFTKTVNWLRLI